MGFSLLLRSTRELWKEWEMRLLVLLSLFLQLTLATQVSQRKYKFRIWIHVMIWTAYTLADSITNDALGIFSNRLANIKDTKGTIDAKTQITAFWAPFLLLHLGGPDVITSFVMEDNELWLRQFLRLCIQVGLSTLLMLAVGMILVGLMKYAERVLCLYLASKGKLRESMLSLPDFDPINPRIMEQRTLREEEGYQVEIDDVLDVQTLEDFTMSSGQAFDERNAIALFKAYELFKVFKLLFLGLIHNFCDLETSKRMFMNSAMDSVTAFWIVEIEFGFMYDLLHTKVPLLNRAWGIIRWLISLSVLCAVLVFFSLQDKKDYAKVDICITFLLISVAILLEIYTGLLALSSYRIDHWRLRRPGGSTISSAVAFLQICPNPRWSNSVAQFSLLGSSIRRRNRICSKYPWLAKLDEKLEKSFYIDYKGVKSNIKEWTFHHKRETVACLEGRSGLEGQLTSLEQEASEVLTRSKNGHLNWSVKDMEFDESILTWHIATELCHDEDRNWRNGQRPEDITNFKMSKLVSRYMLYLMLLHPSMLPAGIGMLRYKDTSIHVQKFLEGKPAVTSKNEGGVASVIIKWVQKLFKEEEYIHTGVERCKERHRSRESRDLCELCHLLRREGNMRRGKSTSVLFDACYLASQLNNIESGEFGSKWRLISTVWAKLLIYAACQCKSYEHRESLSRGGGELLSHIWLLMAHLGFAKAVETIKSQSALKLIKY
ncbi:hypothetical protein ACJRO7_034422 [Eucalyptus globulus]|uniref:DUF4220 domain-containing protein n=1 Tax=Eucalyptus globulus TaxID=34317 RepID=A0ABD3J650_EUCGL